MRLVVFGASGLLGQALLRQVWLRRDLTAVCPSHGEVDLAHQDSVERFVRAVRPDAVLNLAAHMPADACERDPDLAYAVNSTGAANVAVAAQKVSAACIYLSTDFVFDGESGIPYAPTDVRNPLQVYGQTKAAGEDYTRSLCDRGTVIRTASLYGPAGSGRTGRVNFVDRMLERLRCGEQLEIVDDVVMSPTHVDDAAAMIVALLVQPPGVYHVVNRGQASWYELCVEAARMSGLDTSLVPDRPPGGQFRAENLAAPGPSAPAGPIFGSLAPVSIDETTPTARRPRYTVLSTRGLPDPVQAVNRSWREALCSYLYGNRIIA